ncbi:MAG: SDR family oxidoreductase, partial [Cyclobacteriaceae bacterium]
MSKFSFEDLKGKVCLITGGSGVIGTSLGMALVGVGARVVLMSRSENSSSNIAKTIKEQTGGEIIGIQADVLNRQSLEQANQHIKDTFGPVEILINGAGGNAPSATTKVEMMDNTNLDDLSGTFYDLDLDGFRQVFDLNLLGTLLPSMIFTKEMLKKGKGVVLNISSMNAYRPLTKIPAYSAAKSSINNFTEWLSVHLARTGIRVNAVAPGFFLTNQNRFLLTEEKTGELTPRGSRILTNTPMGRFGEPDDLQGAVLYLISDLSAFVT